MDDHNNYAPDAVAGYNVNSIVLEVPISMLTVDGKLHPATDKNAVIGTVGSDRPSENHSSPGCWNCWYSSHAMGTGQSRRQLPDQ
jgi:hypothetical protein